jgi:hypothetical protein
MTTGSLRRPLLAVAGATALILLVPAVAMQYTSEVDWGAGVFVVAAGLLLVTGTAMVLVARHVNGAARRIGAIAMLAAVFLFVWAELAVGIFT